MHNFRRGSLALEAHADTSSGDVPSAAMANPTIKFSVPAVLHERAQAEADRIGVSLPQLALMALVDRLDANVWRSTDTQPKG
jgi:hypothetical protein